MIRKFRLWLVRLIRRWLGLGESFIGIDLGMHEATIVIVSRLKDGQVRIIDTKFNNYREFEEVVHRLQRQYGIRNHEVFVDRPRGIF